jgi:hypothetical protein
MRNAFDQVMAEHAESARSFLPVTLCFLCSQIKRERERERERERVASIDRQSVVSPSVD